MKTRVMNKFIMMSILVLYGTIGAISRPYTKVNKNNPLKAITTGNWAEALQAYYDMSQDPNQASMLAFVIRGLNDFADITTGTKAQIDKKKKSFSKYRRTKNPFDVTKVEAEIKKLGETIPEFVDGWGNLQVIKDEATQAITEDDLEGSVDRMTKESNFLTGFTKTTSPIKIIDLMDKAWAKNLRTIQSGLDSRVKLAQAIKQGSGREAMQAFCEILNFNDNDLVNKFVIPGLKGDAKGKAYFRVKTPIDIAKLRTTVRGMGFAGIREFMKEWGDIDKVKTKVQLTRKKSIQDIATLTDTLKSVETIFYTIIKDEAYGKELNKLQKSLNIDVKKTVEQQKIQNYKDGIAKGTWQLALLTWDDIRNNNAMKKDDKDKIRSALDGKKEVDFEDYQRVQDAPNNIYPINIIALRIEVEGIDKNMGIMQFVQAYGMQKVLEENLKSMLEGNTATDQQFIDTHAQLIKAIKIIKDTLKDTKYADALQVIADSFKDEVNNKHKSITIK